jgi:hypothetical protein
VVGAAIAGRPRSRRIKQPEHVLISVGHYRQRLHLVVAYFVFAAFASSLFTFLIA